MAVQTNVTTETAAVFLDATGGDYLLYKVTPRGAQPIFTLVDSRVDRLLMSNQNAPISDDPLVYQRKWPLPVDSVSTATNHTLGIHFLAATQYRYEVGLYASNGQLKRTLIDITYSSNAPDDWYFQALGITTA
jgi:hypothetical protein